MKFKKARIKKGLTQSSVAGQAGISLQTYRLIEDGVTKNPRPKTAAKIAKILGITEPIGQ